MRPLIPKAWHWLVATFVGAYSHVLGFYVGGTFHGLLPISRVQVLDTTLFGVTSRSPSGSSFAGTARSRVSGPKRRQMAVQFRERLAQWVARGALDAVHDVVSCQRRGKRGKHVHVVRLHTKSHASPPCCATICGINSDKRTPISPSKTGRRNLGHHTKPYYGSQD